MRAIVFILRGCPAGWLGAYGNDWVGTPNLDRLAAEGAVFDRHVSDCPTAAAADRAWRTGRFQHPIASGDGPDQAPDVLLTSLREAGVKTVCVRANHPDTDAPPRYYDGWSEVFDARPEAEHESPLGGLLDRLPSLLDRLAEAPRFLIWVEIDRLLPPWEVDQDVFDAYFHEPELDEETEGEEDFDEEGEDEEGEDDEDDEEAADGDELVDEEGDSAPDEDEADETAPEPEAPSGPAAESDAAPDAEPVEPFANPEMGPIDTTDQEAWDWLRNTYAAVVTSLDAELGAVFEELRTRGLDQTALWAVTSDYGLPLGEHGAIGPSPPWLHEESVHLPLIVRLPGAADAGARIAGLTQPVDLTATLIDLFGALPTAPTDGRALLVDGLPTEERTREHAVSGLRADETTSWAIRTARWALIRTTEPAADGAKKTSTVLYEKPDDRWEVNDLHAREPDAAAAMEQTLREFLGEERR